MERIAGLVTRSSVTLFTSGEERRRIGGRASGEPDQVAEGEVALNASDHSKILPDGVVFTDGGESCHAVSARYVGFCSITNRLWTWIVLGARLRPRVDRDRDCRWPHAKAQNGVKICPPPVSDNPVFRPGENP